MLELCRNKLRVLIHFLLLRFVFFLQHVQHKFLSNVRRKYSSYLIKPKVEHDLQTFWAPSLHLSHQASKTLVKLFKDDSVICSP